MLDALLGIAVQARKDRLATAERGQLHDVPHTGALAFTHYTAFELGDVRNRRTDEQYFFHAAQRAADGLRARVVHQHGRDAAWRALRVLARLVRRADRQARGCCLLENLAADVAAGTG
jgi:hypothetical protein